MTHICPEGHYSEDDDYCSECGKSMNAQSITAQANIAVTPNLDICPDCGTPRAGNDRFCEVCRYDFEQQQSFGSNTINDTVQPVVVPPPMASVEPSVIEIDQPPVQVAVLSVATPIKPQKLQLRIVVDSSINTEPDPEYPCPAGTPEKVFHLDLAENTLGRQYEGKGVCPEIVVHDPGISRRHLKFIRDPQGVFSVLELGSSNGTTINGQSLEPGVVSVIQAKDELVLGMWTRIFIENR